MEVDIKRDMAQIMPLNMGATGKSNMSSLSRKLKIFYMIN